QTAGNLRPRRLPGAGELRRQSQARVPGMHTDRSSRAHHPGWRLRCPALHSETMLRLDDPRWPDLNHRGWAAGRASSYDPGAPFVPGELRHLLTFSRNRERGMNFQGVISKARWSPRSVFPPSRMVSSRIFACGEGLYLLTNPNLGEGDPVRAVGWAESDYWANRVW